MSAQHPATSITDYKLNQQAGSEGTNSTNPTSLKVVGMYCPDFFFLFSQEPSLYRNTTPKLCTTACVHFTKISLTLLSRRYPLFYLLFRTIN